MHEFSLGHLSGGDLEWVVIGRASGQALAVGLCLVLDVESCLVHNVGSLLDTLKLFRAANRCLCGVAGHVEGHAPAVLQVKEMGLRKLFLVTDYQVKEEPSCVFCVKQ